MRFLVVLAINVAAVVSTAQETSYLLAPGQAGDVRIDSSAQSVYGILPREQRRLVDLELEGYLTPALAVTLPGSETDGGIVAELWIRNGALRVHRIWVSDPVMKTAEGIGVGSTMAELRSTYEVTGIGYGEGAVFAVVESLSMSFELDWRQVEPSVVMAGDASRVPDQTPIVRVLVLDPS